MEVPIRSLGALLALGAALVLAACGGGTDEDSGTSATVTQPAVNVTPGSERMVRRRLRHA